jgi:predicted nucleotidyltransferase
MANTINIKEFLFFKKLSQLPFVEKIFLYGSRSRGDHYDRSDIDLAIECPDASFRDWQTILTIIEDADTLLKIDCVRFDTLSESNPLRHSVLRDRVTLYQRGVQ